MEQLRSPAQWSGNFEAAEWLTERLASFGGGVTSVVPAGFGAYARVLRPAPPSRLIDDTFRGDAVGSVDVVDIHCQPVVAIAEGAHEVVQRSEAKGA